MNEERTAPRGLGHRIGSELPTDVIEDASRRLGAVALLYSVTFFLAFFGTHLLGALTGFMVPGELTDRPVQLVVSTVSILAGLGVFVLSRGNRLSARRLLDLGLVFWVLGALGIATSEMWNSVVIGDPRMFVGLSWVCVWILAYPVLAPNSPSKILVAGLSAASMPPLVWSVSTALGITQWENITAAQAVTYFLFSTYLCAGMAFYIARIVHRFGRQLHEARGVGSYRLLERIGEGGMGEVWRAEHKLLAKPAAVKLIRPELFGSTAAGSPEARFEREARATASLRSVHTIELYDYGLADDGLCFYVMEMLDGLSLEELVDRNGAQTPGRVIHILRQVCRSLEEAHDAGFVHRDIKPANIFLCRLGADVDFVKVLDFGLVKGGESAELGDPNLTGHGVIAGTPAYAAPEMMQETDIDGRTDLYGLGCVAYWLLTSTPVFTSTTPVALIVDHAKEEPESPSKRLGEAVPRDLEAVVLRCLEKSPEARYPTAADLERALSECESATDWTRPIALDWWDTQLPAAPSTHDSGSKKA